MYVAFVFAEKERKDTGIKFHSQYIAFQSNDRNKIRNFLLERGSNIFCLCEDIKVWFGFYFTNRNFEGKVSIYFTIRPRGVVLFHNFAPQNYFTILCRLSPPQNNISRRISKELSRIRILSRRQGRYSRWGYIPFPLRPVSADRWSVSRESRSGIR